MRSQQRLTISPSIGCFQDTPPARRGLSGGGGSGRLQRVRGHGSPCGQSRTLQNLLRAVIQQRPSAVRWAYLPVAFVSVLFSLMGWDDGGFSAAWPFILLLIVCLIQSTYPTLLGWALLLVPCVGYPLDVAFSPENGTRGDYVFCLLCGAVPAAVLLFLRPKISLSSAASKCR